MLEEVISILKNSRADDWSITDTRKQNWEFYFIRHNLDQNRIVNTEHIQLTVYKKSADGKYLGSASDEIAPTASAEEIKKTVNDLIFRAGLINNPVYALRQPAPSSNENHQVDVSSLGRDFINTMNAVAETKTEDINSYEIFTGQITRRLITSTGIDHTETYPSSMLEVVTNARNDKEEIELYRMYHSGTCDTEGLKKDIEKTLQYGKDRLKTVPTPNIGTTALVLSTADALQVYNYFASRLNAQYVYQGLSDWKIGHPVSTDVKGDKVTLRAGKFLPNSSRNFDLDEEGAVIHDMCLLQDDVPQNYWGNAMFSSYMNLKDTFLVSNIEADGGTKSEEEIRSGNYLEVVEFSDFQVNPLTGDIFGEIRLGYLHQDGKVTEVSGGSVSGSMRDYIKEMYISKETVQYDHARIPAVTKLMNVTVTGAEK